VQTTPSTPTRLITSLVIDENVVDYYVLKAYIDVVLCHHPESAKSFADAPNQ
jgi:hypothetical protein